MRTNDKTHQLTTPGKALYDPVTTKNTPTYWKTVSLFSHRIQMTPFVYLGTMRGIGEVDCEPYQTEYEASHDKW